MCKQVEDVEDEDDGEKIWKIFPFAEYNNNKCPFTRIQLNHLIVDVHRA